MRRTVLTCGVIALLLLSVFIPDSSHAWNTRPMLMGQRGIVGSGHYLADQGAMAIMQSGGNAIDAGVTASLAQGLLEYGYGVGFGGEIPMLIYSAKDKKVYNISGNMVLPKKITIEWFNQEGIQAVPPEGFLGAGVPPVLDTIILALDRFGTKSFAEIAAPAIYLAEQGFPMYQSYQQTIELNEKWFKEEWPTSYASQLPNGRVPRVGEVFKNPDFASMLKRVVQAEKDALAKGATRSEALRAARDYFYKGPIAREIVAFTKKPIKDRITKKAYPGFFEVSDFEEFRAKFEEPMVGTYMGYEVYKCGPWTQGPVFIQHLNLLENFDIKNMKPTDPEYIHIWIETAKLAHADKVAYYGDPDFVYVPMKGLLSKEYAKERAKMVDLKKNNDAIRPGDPWKYDDHPEKKPQALVPSQYVPIPGYGTTSTRAIDKDGNMYSATPSFGNIDSSPTIPGLGFSLSTRGQMFYLDPKNPKAVQGGKRPTTTLTPSLVLKNGKPWAVFGTSGGDEQDQHTLQNFLNVVVFGMNVQEAIDFPKYDTQAIRSLFYPFRIGRRGKGPVMRVESRMPEETLKKLEAIGHPVLKEGPWAFDLSHFLIIEDGMIYGGVSPRRETNYGIAW